MVGREPELTQLHSWLEEASALITHGLGLLQTLPDTPERTEQEIQLQLTLGAVEVVSKGHAAPEAGRAYTRAYELCQQLGETPQLFPALAGLFNFRHLRAEHHVAHELAQRKLQIAQRVDDPALLLSAHLSLDLWCALWVS